MTESAAAPAFGVLVTFKNGDVYAFERTHGVNKRNYGKSGPMGGFGEYAWKFTSEDKAKAKFEEWVSNYGSKDEVASFVVLPAAEVTEKAHDARHTRLAAAALANARSAMTDIYNKWVKGGKNLTKAKFGYTDYYARVLISNGVIDAAGNIIKPEELNLP